MTSFYYFGEAVAAEEFYPFSSKEGLTIQAGFQLSENLIFR